MSLRIFRCPHCGHSLRLGVTRCSQCETPAPLMNMTMVHLAFFAVALLVAIVGTVLIAG